MRAIESAQCREIIKCLPQGLDNVAENEYQKQLAFEKLTEGKTVLMIALLIYDWRMGIATVIVAGNTLMLGGQITLFSYILSLIAASRLYDPLSGAMANMAELFAVDLQVNRLKAIQNYKEENKEKEYHTDGYDITFDHVKFACEDGEPVVRDVSFAAKQGQVTGLVGPSGDGKSTVANLAAGFYDVDGIFRVGID